MEPYGASVLGTTGTEELTAQYVQGSCRYQLVNLPRHTEHHQHIASINEIDVEERKSASYKIQTRKIPVWYRLGYHVVSRAETRKLSSMWELRSGAGGQIWTSRSESVDLNSTPSKYCAVGLAD